MDQEIAPKEAAHPPLRKTRPADELETELAHLVEEIERASPEVRRYLSYEIGQATLRLTRAVDSA